jgi:large conductance mechanosensitive channel
MWDEFKEFALGGNVVDMAIGIIIGAALSTVVDSLVNDIILPPIGLLLGGVDFHNLYWILAEGDPAGPYSSLSAAQAAGAVTINWGLFLNAVISFLVVSFVIFIVIREVNQLRGIEEPVEEPTSEPCPYCKMDIPIGAVRCGHCAVDLSPV